MKENISDAEWGYRYPIILPPVYDLVGIVVASRVPANERGPIFSRDDAGWCVSLFGWAEVTGEPAMLNRATLPS